MAAMECAAAIERGRRSRAGLCIAAHGRARLSELYSPMDHPEELFGAYRSRRYGSAGSFGVDWTHAPKDPALRFMASDVLVEFADTGVALGRVSSILSSFAMVSCAQQGDNLLRLVYGDPKDYGFEANVEFYRTAGASGFLGVRRITGEVIAFHAFAVYFAKLVTLKVPGSRRA